MLEGELRRTLSENFNRCWMSYHSTKGFIEKVSWTKKMIAILLAGLRTLGPGEHATLSRKAAITKLNKIRDSLNILTMRAISEGALTKADRMAIELLNLDNVVDEVLELYILTGFAVAKLPYEDAFELIEPSRRPVNYTNKQ